MKGNAVVAASILALGLVIASVVIVVGLGQVADHAAGRIEAAVSQHGQKVEQAGVAAGTPIHTGLSSLEQSVQAHAKSIEQAGATISKATVTIPQANVTIPEADVSMNGLLKLVDPVTVKGPNKDGALPVEAQIAK